MKLKNAGFILKDATWKWSKSEESQLIEAIKEINEIPNQVHVKDVNYYIAQYKFQGKVPTKVIKKKINELINNK
jgi:hypothetical protein